MGKIGAAGRDWKGWGKVTEELMKFHLEEYRLLRAENAANIKFIYDTFLWGTIASGAIAAWLLANSATLAALGGFQARAAWFVPLIVATVAFAGNRHFVAMTLHTADYIGKLEAELALPGLGWEAHERTNKRHSNARAADWRMGIGWVILGLADLSLAIFVR